MDHHLEIVKTNIKYPIVFYNHQFNKNRPVSSHYHQDIEVVYVVSGKVEAYIDGKKEIFHQGEMFIINSHSVHQFNFPNRKTYFNVSTLSKTHTGLFIR